MVVHQFFFCGNDLNFLISFEFYFGDFRLNLLFLILIFILFQILFFFYESFFLFFLVFLLNLVAFLADILGDFLSQNVSLFINQLS